MGPEFGGSIGIIFIIANAMDCALNTVGFAQTVLDMMKTYGGGMIIVDGGDNDIRIISVVAIFLICTVCGLGSYYETKVLKYYKDFLIFNLQLTIPGTDEKHYVTYYADFPLKFPCWKHYGSFRRIGTSTRIYRLQQ